MFGLEAFYERSWTGPMLFSMIDLILYIQVLAFTKGLVNAWHKLSICVPSVDQAFSES